LYLDPENEEAQERTTLRYDWRDKGIIEEGLQLDQQKKYFFKLLELK